MRIQLIKSRRVEDARGWFAETWNRERFAALGIDVDFCQSNHVLSRATGVLRGLHFQRPPQAQAKLVRCVRGRLWDVAVDIRTGSPTYGRHVNVELAADDGLSLFVPAGYAHGYLTLEPMTEIDYKVSAPYATECEGGVAWNDSQLNIPWPLPSPAPILSNKDRALPHLAELTSPFAYDGVPLEPLGEARAL